MINSHPPSSGKQVMGFSFGSFQTLLTEVEEPTEDCAHLFHPQTSFNII